MSSKEILDLFPNKRIKPVDGMAVTAAVWEESHDYHRQHQQYHAMLGHGPGILTGLEVIASDPPDSAVYIRPGMAIAGNGQTVVLTQPLRYDFGRTAQGQLHLLLNYSESRPRAGGNGSSSDSLLYVHDQFAVEAQLALPEPPFVELARIRRHGRGAVIQNAAEPNQPRPNEIDLRFRQQIGAIPQRPISIAVSYVGEMTDMGHGHGLHYLTRFLTRSGAFGRNPVCVDNNVFLDEHLNAYTLVCLVGRQEFALNQEEMTAIYNYIQAGGTIFYESCRHETDASRPAADASFDKLLASLGLKVEDLPSNSPLLDRPFLFAKPPAGYEAEGVIRLKDGVIFSNYDFGCLWRAEQRGAAPGREAIRAALEWGGNIVSYAQARRMK